MTSVAIRNRATMAPDGSDQLCLWVPGDAQRPLDRAGAAEWQTSPVARTPPKSRVVDRDARVRLTLREASRIVAEAMRAGSWKQEPLGQEVRRYLLYLRNSRDASARTLEDYESLLARFVVEHAHLTIGDFEGAVGAERVLEFVASHWGASARERAQGARDLRLVLRLGAQVGSDRLQPDGQDRPAAAGAASSGTLTRWPR